MKPADEGSWATVGGPTNRSILIEVVRNLALVGAGVAFQYWMQGRAGARSRIDAMLVVVVAIMFTLPALNNLRRRTRWRRNVQKLEAELSPQLAALGISVPTAVYTAGAGTRLVWVELGRVFEIILLPSGREAALMEVAAPTSFLLDEQHLEEWDAFDRRDLVAAAEAEVGEPLADRVTHRGRWLKWVAVRAATPALVVRRLLELARRPPVDLRPRTPEL